MEIPVVKIKFRNGIGIGLPNGSMLTPNIYPHTKEVAGFARPVAIQDYHFDEDEYDVRLLPESPEELPESIAKGDKELQSLFKQSQASVLAGNHMANQQVRMQLRAYEKEGLIEIVGDSTLDAETPGKKDGKFKETKFQDGTQIHASDEDSLDVKSERENQKDPNPAGNFTGATGGDANERAQAEQNASKDEQRKAKGEQDKKSK